MANSFLTDDIITLEALDIFENELNAVKSLATNKSKLFGKHGGSNRGATVRIRKPNQYSVRTGATYSAGDVTDEKVDLTIDQQIGVDTFVTSADMALKLSDFSEQVIRPQVVLLANYVDRYFLANAYKEVYSSVGTPGTIPNALETYLEANALLDEYAAPRNDRSVVLGPRMNFKIVDALKGLNEADEQISSQYKSGRMRRAAGFDWRMDQNVAQHTVGPLGGTPLVNGASQTGSSLITDGWTAAAASRLKKGDVFTVAGVYSVNPVSKESTGVLQQFVVTADFSSDAGGAGTISISPSITPTGAQKTVSNSPADNAALTIVGAANTLAGQGLAGVKSAAAIAFAPLDKPEGTDMSSVKSDKQLGVSMRFVRWYDGDNDRFKARFDVLFGIKVLRPEWLVRIQSGAA